ECRCGRPHVERCGRHDGERQEARGPDGGPPGVVPSGSLTFLVRDQGEARDEDGGEREQQPSRGLAENRADDRGERGGPGAEADPARDVTGLDLAQLAGVQLEPGTPSGAPAGCGDLRGPGPAASAVRAPSTASVPPGTTDQTRTVAHRVPRVA